MATRAAKRLNEYFQGDDSDLTANENREGNKSSILIRLQIIFIDL